MKKCIAFLLTVILCFVCADGASAQRTLPGQWGLQVTAGTVNGLNLNDSFHSGIAFSQYAQNANKWVFGIEYLEKRHPYKDIEIPQSQITGDVGYFLNFLSDPHKIFFLSLGASAMAGYETINWNKKLLFDGATITNKDNFLYGGALTLEMEFYLTDRTIFLINARERLLMGSSVGNFNTQLGLGIKFIIN